MIDSYKAFIADVLCALGAGESSLGILTFLVLMLSAALLSWIAGRLCQQILIPITLKVVARTSHVWDDYLFNRPVLKAACHVVPGIVFYQLLPHCLSKGQETLGSIATCAVQIYITATLIWLANAFLSNIVVYTSEHEKLKSHHLNGIIQFLKMAVFCIGCIVIVAFLFGRNPLSIIAGLGAAATVLMLVFKDSILGLVAGIQLSVNHMLKKGDWVTIQKLDIDGVVEEVSLTTVKIRNFDNTISTVPPYTLVSDSFQNWAPMFQSGGRRVKRALYIDVNTIRFATEREVQSLRGKGLLPEDAGAGSPAVNLTLFRAYAEAYLHSLPHVIDDKFVLARQLSPTPEGLPLEFWFYSNVTEFARYESLAAHCIEHFIAVLPQFGLRLFQAPAGSDLRNAVKGRKPGTSRGAKQASV